MGRVAIDSKALGDFVRANLTLLIMVVATVILFVTLEYCIGYSPPRDDVINFYNHAEAMKDGLLPYKDFEFEFQLAQMNRHLDADIETVLLMPSPKYFYTSSTIIKQVSAYSPERVKKFVPENVLKLMLSQRQAE